MNLSCQTFAVSILGTKIDGGHRCKHVLLPYQGELRCKIRANTRRRSKAGFESQISPFSTLNATRKFLDRVGAEWSSDSALIPETRLNLHFRSRIDTFQPDFPPITVFLPRAAPHAPGAHTQVAVEIDRALYLTHLAGGFRNHPVQAAENPILSATKFPQFEIADQPAVSAVAIECGPYFFDGLDFNNFTRLKSQGSCGGLSQSSQQSGLPKNRFLIFLRERHDQKRDHFQSAHSA